MAKKPVITVKLVKGVGVVEEKQNISAGKRLCWKNSDDRAHILSFDEWPFVELPQEISLPVGKTSRIFTVYKKQTRKGYSYGVVPPISDGPPDTPEIVVGD